MNKILLKGRLTKDIEVRYSQSANPVAIANSSLAVPRKFHRQGEQDTDFFNIRAIGKQAEFLDKYFTKGQEILICGEMQMSTYMKDNVKHTYPVVFVSDIDFCGKKSDNSTYSDNNSQNSNNFGTTIGEIYEDDDLPF